VSLPCCLDELGIPFIAQRLCIGRFFTDEAQTGDAATFLINGDERLDVREITQVIDELPQLLWGFDVTTEKDVTAGLEFLETGGGFGVEGRTGDAGEEQLAERHGEERRRERETLLASIKAKRLPALNVSFCHASAFSLHPFIRLTDLCHSSSRSPGKASSCSSQAGEETEPKPDDKKPEPPKPDPAKPEPAKPAPPPATVSTATAQTVRTPAPTSTVTTKPVEKKKTVAEVTKGHQRIVRGLFDLFLDREKGTVHLYIKKEQLGPEFIYFTHTMDGVVQAGHNRGSYGSEVIFRIAKVFERMEFVAENTAFYFDPQSALARAKKANISHAILASESIVAEDAGGFLISAGNLFLKESLVMVKSPGGDGSKAVLGKLSDTKTKFTNLRGYPDNTVIGVEYVFENPAPTWTSDSKVKANEITDARYVSIKVQHSLIKLPDNDFKPRFDDPRIGYFGTQVTDMTSADVTPYRDVIHRWNLTKQKPGTKLSEPVEPITFWIENTTPVELRDLIRSATLKWNEALKPQASKTPSS
jgi:hypothetical protein